LASTVAACTSFQQTPDARPQEGVVTRIEQRGSPLIVAVRATDTSPTFSFCEASLVDGRISRVIGDTVIFSSVTRLDPLREGDQACVSAGAARVVLGPPGRAIVSVERQDTRRTIGAGLLFGLMGAMLLGGM